MNYKTTYFSLSLNKDISISKDLIEECLIKDEILNEIADLEKEVSLILNRCLDSVRIFTTLKGIGGMELEFDESGLPRRNTYYEEYLELTLDERELFLQHFKLDNILNWTRLESIDQRRIKFDNNSLLSLGAVKKLKSLRERLNKVNEVKSRYTKEDEENLGMHLNDIASDGWKLHSMNPIIKGIFKSHIDNDAGYGYGHNIQEGFILVWEKG